MNATPLRVALAWVPLLSAACGPSTPPPRFTSRPPGCDVTVYRGALPNDVAVTSIEPVTAPCGKNDADSDCIRALQDRVCKLGGDVVYEVPAKPVEDSSTMMRYDGIAGVRKDSPVP